MIEKRFNFPRIGPGVGFEFGFDKEGWWIDHADGSRHYILLGLVKQHHDIGIAWALHFFWFKFILAILKKD